MNGPPPWLPPMAVVNPWTNATYETLYSIFKKDFKDSQPVYNGKAVWFFPELDSGKEVVFWHMTSRVDQETGERLPEPAKVGTPPLGAPNNGQLHSTRNSRMGLRRGRQND